MREAAAIAERLRGLAEQQGKLAGLIDRSDPDAMDSEFVHSHLSALSHGLSATLEHLALLFDDAARRG